LPQRRIEGPRYQSDLDRLRDAIGDRHLTPFRSQSYFTDTISHQLLDIRQFALRDGLCQVASVALQLNLSKVECRGNRSLGMIADVLLGVKRPHVDYRTLPMSKTRILRPAKQEGW